MTEYEQQMLQWMQNIHNLLLTCKSSLDAVYELVSDFFLSYSPFIYCVGYGILFVLILKWLSRW